MIGQKPCPDRLRLGMKLALVGQVSKPARCIGALTGPSRSLQCQESLIAHAPPTDRFAH